MKKIAILAVLLMASTACSTMDEDMSMGGSEDEIGRASCRERV